MVLQHVLLDAKVGAAIIAGRWEAAVHLILGCKVWELRRWKNHGAVSAVPWLMVLAGGVEQYNILDILAKPQTNCYMSVSDGA